MQNNNKSYLNLKCLGKAVRMPNVCFNPIPVHYTGHAFFTLASALYTVTAELGRSRQYKARTDFQNKSPLCTVANGRNSAQLKPQLRAYVLQH